MSAVSASASIRPLTILRARSLPNGCVAAPSANAINLFGNAVID